LSWSKNIIQKQGNNKNRCSTAGHKVSAHEKTPFRHRYCKISAQQIDNCESA
jgi:hypothetical protein